MPKGCLPNLYLGAHGEDALTTHRRYVSLQRNHISDLLDVPDALLPSIPQRTPAWFRARQTAVTASSAALWVGMKEHTFSKALASKGLCIYADDGHQALLQAIQELQSAAPLPTAPKPRSPFAACAMEMGTIKESDVLLTYLNFMDANRECASSSICTSLILCTWKVMHVSGKLMVSDLSCLPMTCFGYM